MCSLLGLSTGLTASTLPSLADIAPLSGLADITPLSGLAVLPSLGLGAIDWMPMPLLQGVLIGIVIMIILRAMERAYANKAAAQSNKEMVIDMVASSIEDTEDNTIDIMASQMIRSVLELPDTSVRQIMVPGPDMVCVTEDMTIDEVVDVMLAHGHSRHPVKSAQKQEKILGLVYTKDVLKHLHIHKGDDDWLALMRPPWVVPEAATVSQLLTDLQKQEIHMALVVNEYGDFTGLVTIEDILEEIVGEIVDEHDDEEPILLESGDTYWVVDAKMPIHELNEISSLALPDEDWDTVGGLLFNTIGQVPTPGLTLDMPEEGIRMTCMDVQGTRIKQVRVDLLEGDATP